MLPDMNLNIKIIKRVLYHSRTHMYNVLNRIYNDLPRFLVEHIICIRMNGYNTYKKIHNCQSLSC